MNCMNCEKSFKPDLDACLCNDCINKAYSHRPRQHVKITLHGYGTYVEPIERLALALEGELANAEYGAKWTLELIEMSDAERLALPEFQGH